MRNLRPCPVTLEPSTDMKPSFFLWRRTALVAVLLLLPPSLAAQEHLYQFFVWMQSGEKTGYLFTEDPYFVPDGDVLHFRTRSIRFDIPRDQLDRFTIEEVLPEHPTATSLPTTLDMSTRRTAKLAYRLTPTDAVTTVSWLNTAPDVLSVAPDGTLTALTTGEATVTAQTSNGLRASCRVTVSLPHLKFFVWQRNGVTLGYELDEHPAVTIDPEAFVLTTTDTRIEYAPEDILQFTLEDVAVSDPTVGIRQLTADEAASAAFRPGDLTFNHLCAGEHVRVYDAAGRLAAQAVATADGNLRLSTQNLPAGIYVVKTERSTFKIQKQ